MTADKSQTKSSSKTNLNESNIPLLDDGDNLKSAGKIELELETKNSSNNEANNAETATTETTDGAPKKVRRPIHVPNPVTVATNATSGLNVVSRDGSGINNHVNLEFGDIIGETDANQGFEFIWRLTFLIFTFSRLWLYRIISAVLAIPFALIWAIIFSAINLTVVWFATPTLKVYDLLLHHIHRIWGGLVRTFLDPVFSSIGLIYASRTPVSNVNTVV